jgi:hypothetical protein
MKPVLATGMARTRLIVALTAALACLFIVFDAVLFRGWGDGFRSRFGSEWVAWREAGAGSARMRGSAAGDEYMLGVGKADITGVVLLL